MTAEQSIAQTQEGIDNDYDFLEGLGDGERPHPRLHRASTRSNLC